MPQNAIASTTAGAWLRAKHMPAVALRDGNADVLRDLVAREVSR